MPLSIRNKSARAENSCATHRMQPEGTEIRRGLAAVREKLVRRGVVHTLVCEKLNDKRVRGSKIVDWRRGKKVWQRRRRIVNHREHKKACV